jgi:hypothetical protein
MQITCREINMIYVEVTYFFVGIQDKTNIEAVVESMLLSDTDEF